MKKLNNLIFILFLSIIPFFQSCDESEEVPLTKDTYTNGIFIINEGNFSDADGSVSWYDLDSAKVFQKVFESVNERPFAGILQSMSFHDGKGYLVDNFGRLEAVDEKTFLSTGIIEEVLDNPRHIAFYGQNGYLTTWGPYDDNYNSNESVIAVIDLNNLTISKKIDTKSRPEGIIAVDDKLFVANSNSTYVSIISTGSDEITRMIEVPFGPSGFAMDKNGIVWVICTGGWGGNGSLVQIDPEAEVVVGTINMDGDQPNGKIAINGSGDELFFMTSRYLPDFSTENAIIKVPIDIQNGILSVIVTGTNLYGLGVDPVNDLLYVADANAFQGNGTVIRYDLSGNRLDDFISGRGPNGFVFQDIVE